MWFYEFRVLGWWIKKEKPKSFIKRWQELQQVFPVALDHPLWGCPVKMASGPRHLNYPPTALHIMQWNTRKWTIFHENATVMNILLSEKKNGAIATLFCRRKSLWTTNSREESAEIRTVHGTWWSIVGSRFLHPQLFHLSAPNIKLTSFIQFLIISWYPLLDYRPLFLCNNNNNNNQDTRRWRNEIKPIRGSLLPMLTHWTRRTRINKMGILSCSLLRLENYSMGVKMVNSSQSTARERGDTNKGRGWLKDREAGNGREFLSPKPNGSWGIPLPWLTQKTGDANKQTDVL